MSFKQSWIFGFLLIIIPFVSGFNISNENYTLEVITVSGSMNISNENYTAEIISNPPVVGNLSNENYTIEIAFLYISQADEEVAEYLSVDGVGGGAKDIIAYIIYPVIGILLLSPIIILAIKKDKEKKKKKKQVKQMLVTKKFKKNKEKRLRNELRKV